MGRTIRPIGSTVPPRSGPVAGQASDWPQEFGKPSRQINPLAQVDGSITPGLPWTPGSTVFYRSGRQIWRWDDPRVSNVQSDLILEMTVGGWDNNAVNDKQLPVDYVIDYVRVWQRKDLASGVDGVPPAGNPAAK